MRVPLWPPVLVLSLAVLALVASRRNDRPTAAGSSRRHIVLIGASIGRGWALDQWPARAGAPGYTAEAIAVWKFDKTEGVDEVLLRPARKFALTRTYLRSLFESPPRRPQIVILKECSAYFPGDLAAYQKQTRLWVERLAAGGMEVMLATVVPVTRARSLSHPGKQEKLVEYNAWIREYAGSRGLAVLDLEAALSQGGAATFLRDEYAAADGSHLNAAAYSALDKLLAASVQRSAPAQSALTPGKSTPLLP